jgi:hypothetical protein
VTRQPSPEPQETGAQRHPSGVRVVRREHVYEVGPAANDGELFRLLADLIADGELVNVDSVVVDWRDDGGYLAVHTSSYVILQGLRSA